MIEICPSVLVKDIETFQKEFNRMQIFPCIDIDIIRSNFIPSTETAQLTDTMPLIEQSQLKTLAFHLMVSDPLKDIDLIMQSKIKDWDLRIYFHQEVNLNFLNSMQWPNNWRKGVTVKLESDLKDLEFYNKFNEVQFMSIITGAQGNKPDWNVLGKVDELRDLGYKGLTSIDGGVNLNSALFIKKHDINRVSPGSYFRNASDIELAKMKLELALNMPDKL